MHVKGNAAATRHRQDPVFAVAVSNQLPRLSCTRGGAHSESPARRGRARRPDPHESAARGHATPGGAGYAAATGQWSKLPCAR